MSRFWRHFISNGADSGQDPNYFAPECGYLGLHARNVPLPPALARRYDLTGADGVEVMGVEEGGPAEQAGLQEADVIVALDAEPTTSMDDLHRRLTTLPVGVPVIVTLLRRERRLERMVVPTEYPNSARIGERGV